MQNNIKREGASPAHASGNPCLLVAFFLWLICLPCQTEAADHFCSPTKELSASMESYFDVPAHYYGSTSQGMCVAGDYIIYTRYTSDFKDTVYVILDKETGKEVSHQSFATQHSNSLTFNPDKNEVVAVTNSHAYIFRFFNGTLTLQHDIVMSHNFPKIAYVQAKQMYYLGTGTAIYGTRDFYHFDKIFQVPELAVNQGMGCDGSYIYIMWYYSYHNTISVYSLEGKAVTTFTVISDKYREVEEVDFDDGQMYINIAASGEYNGIYKVKPKHEYKDWTVEKEPTCAEEGIEVSKCIRCGKETDRPIAKTKDHKMGAWKLDREAECELAGLEVRRCKICDKLLKQREIPALGHQMSQWKVKEEATAVSTGLWEKYCFRCGKKEWKKTSKLQAFLKVNATSLTLQVGQKTDKLRVELGPGDAIISWYSDSTKIADVDEKGRITAHRLGETKIIATTKTKLKVAIPLSVQLMPVWTTELRVYDKKKELIGKEVILKEGETFPLKISIKPLTSTSGVHFYDFDKDVASISKHGVITGKKEGQARVLVRSGMQFRWIKVRVQK